MSRDRHQTTGPRSSGELSALLSSETLQLLTASGVELIQQIGFDVVQGILLDIMCGRNVRDTTELVTRRRVATLNLALLVALAKGSAASTDFVAELPHRAVDILMQGGLTKYERVLAQWLLGLTNKGVQNVLWNDLSQLPAYRDRYVQACQEIITEYKQQYGELEGTLSLDGAGSIHVDWLFFAYLLNVTGAQTLTIRGSSKSAYGKLFERLILGSMLHILGFQYVPAQIAADGVFWLSSPSKRRRESDATLIYRLGQGVSFDIGFIGAGNSEISLDKTSRFSREAEVGGKRHYMATIVIVDRIPGRGQLRARAQELDADIVQMSGSYSPQEVARVLHQRLGFEHELVDMAPEDIEDYLRARLSSVPLVDFINNLPAAEFDAVEQSE